MLWPDELEQRNPRLAHRTDEPLGRLILRRIRMHIVQRVDPPVRTVIGDLVKNPAAGIALEGHTAHGHFFKGLVRCIWGQWVEHYETPGSSMVVLRGVGAPTVHQTNLIHRPAPTVLVKRQRAIALAHLLG